MQRQTANDAESVAILLVAHDGVAQVFHVHTDLVLASRLQQHFHQADAFRGGQRVIVCDGFLAAVVRGAAVGDEGLVVLQPAAHGAAFLLHLSAHHGHVSAVKDDAVPVLLQNALRLLCLGIHHQSAGLAVQAVHHMCRAFEVALLEVLVQDGLHAVLSRCRCHAQDALAFFNDDDVLVLIDDFHKLAVQLRASLVAGHAHHHALLQGIVKPCHQLAVHRYGVSGQQVLHAVAAGAAHLFHEEGHQRGFLSHRQFNVL